MNKMNWSGRSHNYKRNKIIFVEDLLKKLNKKNISFFSGVPDSILKDFCNTLSNFGPKKHIIATNEGSAISLGIGYFLSKENYYKMARVPEVLELYNISKLISFGLSTFILTYIFFG